MLILVRAIGIVIIVMGIAVLLSPRTMKQLIAFWSKGKRIYLAGVLRVAIAVILLLAASACKRVGIILTLGILILIGGIMIFALPLQKMRSMLTWWEKKPLWVLRLMGLIAIAIGALLPYSA